MAKITRRAALAAIPAAGLAPIIQAVSKPVDPIIDAIAAYRAGNEAYERHPICRTLGWTDEESDAVIRATYGPPLEVLSNWDRPAVTKEGAVAALRFIQDEAQYFSRPDCLESMLAAALGYFEANI